MQILLNYSFDVINYFETKSTGLFKHSYINSVINKCAVIKIINNSITNIIQWLIMQFILVACSGI